MKALRLLKRIAAAGLRNALLCAREPFALMARHRTLLVILLRRDIAVRTSGTVLGSLWMFAQPALQVVSLWFLLDIVLRVRLPGAVPFRDYYLAGMLPWLMVSEIVIRAFSVLSEFAPLYQRSVFPVRLLPLVPIATSAMTFGPIYVVTMAILDGPAAALGAVLVVVVVSALIVPLCYLVATLGLFVRDTRQAAPLALSMLMFISPIMFMPESLPDVLRDWLWANPVADGVACIHALTQGLPWSAGNVWRPLVWWGVLLAPAWWLFTRTEPYMREEI